MPDSITNIIIKQLENQKTAIETALAALQELDGEPTTAPQIGPAATPEAPTAKRKQFSAASRKKMALAQKARWAKIKGKVEPPSPPTPEAPKARRQISAEGLQRIIAATKKRWRLQRAAAKAAFANVAPKKAAVTKAAPGKKAVKKSAAVPTPALAQAAG
jgi:hypothetical protein